MICCFSLKNFDLTMTNGWDLLKLCARHRSLYYIIIYIAYMFEAFYLKHLKFKIFYFKIKKKENYQNVQFLQNHLNIHEQGTS